MSDSNPELRVNVYVNKPALERDPALLEFFGGLVKRINEIEALDTGEPINQPPVDRIEVTPAATKDGKFLLRVASYGDVDGQEVVGCDQTFTVRRDVTVGESPAFALESQTDFIICNLDLLAPLAKIVNAYNAGVHLVNPN